MAVVASISQQIWDMKYRLRGTFGRAARQDDRGYLAARGDRAGRPRARPSPVGRTILRCHERFQISAGGPCRRRVPAAAAQVTLFNCFVMGTIPDDMGGIFAHLREAALTMQQGGGIGYDFSTLRPRGAPVKGVGADASGPLSFMDVWDAMCRTIMSAGYRRGAMMATLRCDHPDIEDFIEAKREPGRLRMFNLSVLVTDAFMKAVEEDAPWELFFGGPDGAKTTWKVLPARELWDKIMRATYAYAEPGVIFIDRINQRNNFWYCETDHGHEPLRRAAAAALWRVPLGLDQSGEPRREPVRPRCAARSRPAAPAGAGLRPDDGQCHRHLAVSVAPADRKRRARSAASASG